MTGLDLGRGSKKLAAFFRSPCNKAHSVLGPLFLETHLCECCKALLFMGFIGSQEPVSDQTLQSLPNQTLGRWTPYMGVSKN